MKKNSPGNNTVNLVYKKLGETPNEAILRLKEENPEFDLIPMTYAGRLDPMAEGLLLILSGDGINDKQKYLDLPKTYEAEVLWGFETDTLDLLGLSLPRSDLGKTKVNEDEVGDYLEKSKGKFEQMYPLYSSRPVGGKSLFQWAREGKAGEIEIPKHEVEIFESNFIERRNISGEELLKDILRRVSLVKGDFRQKEIIEKWRKVLEDKKSEEFFMDKISMKVSSGFYVRQFVSDLGREFRSGAVTFSIKRVKIGDYSADNWG